MIHFYKEGCKFQLQENLLIKHLDLQLILEFATKVNLKKILSIYSIRFQLQKKLQLQLLLQNSKLQLQLQNSKLQLQLQNTHQLQLQNTHQLQLQNNKHLHQLQNNKHLHQHQMLFCRIVVRRWINLLN